MSENNLMRLTFALSTALTLKAFHNLLSGKSIASGGLEAARPQILNNQFMKFNFNLILQVTSPHMAHDELEFMFERERHAYALASHVGFHP